MPGTMALLAGGLRDQLSLALENAEQVGVLKHVLGKKLGRETGLLSEFGAQMG